MKTAKLICLVALVFLCILAIYILITHTSTTNENLTLLEKFNNIEFRTSKAKVKQILGEPNLETTEIKNNDLYVLWHYQVSLESIDIYFMNNKVYARYYVNGNQALCEINKKED